MSTFTDRNFMLWSLLLEIIASQTYHHYSMQEAVAREGQGQECTGSRSPKKETGPLQNDADVVDARGLGRLWTQPP